MNIAESAQDNDSMNQLDTLRQWTTVVADTGRFQRQLVKVQAKGRDDQPFADPEGSAEIRCLSVTLLDDDGRQTHRDKPIDEVIDRSAGALRHRNSFDHSGTGFHRSRRPIELRHGCHCCARQAHRCNVRAPRASKPAKRVLIKIASTWEGIQAAKRAAEQGGIQHQPHAAVLVRPGGGMCGDAKRHAHLAFRGTHLRLAQEGGR